MPATAEQKTIAKNRRETMRGLVKRLSAMNETDKAAFYAKLPAIFTVDGHPLSRVNQCLCYWQGMQQPEIVGGIRQWNREGRFVRKGEHGYSIWVPTFRAAKNEDETETGEVKGGFVLATIFALSQTEPMEG